jgi:hypothetical protein
MLISQGNEVALTKRNKSGLLVLNLGGNEIGSEGCEYLSQAKWPNLTNLDLAGNNISSEGVMWICKSNWPLLNKLSLGTFVMFRLQPNQQRRMPRIMQSEMG